MAVSASAPRQGAMNSVGDWPTPDRRCARRTGWWAARSARWTGLLRLFTAVTDPVRGIGRARFGPAGREEVDGGSYSGHDTAFDVHPVGHRPRWVGSPVHLEPGHRVGAVDPEVLNGDAGDHTRGSPECGHAFVGVAGPPCRPLPGDVVGEQGPEAVEIACLPGVEVGDGHVPGIQVGTEYRSTLSAVRLGFGDD